VIHITVFRKAAKLTYVTAKNFRQGRGLVVLPRIHIYPFVRSASQPQDTIAFARSPGLEDKFHKRDYPHAGS